MTSSVVVQRRYRGPEESGNGGWTAGLLAEAHGGVTEVTLRLPPPLDLPLEVHRDGDRLLLRDGERLVAEATSAHLSRSVPRTVGIGDAKAAAASYAGADEHMFPGCFVCGPDRTPGDGLRIFPGPVGDDLVAAPWTPDESLVDDEGAVRVAAVWAALDCPSGWSGDLSPGRPAVLGRLAVDARRLPAPGEACVVIGWPLEDRGKSFVAGSALQSSDGEVLAVARATWVRVSPDWQPPTR